MNGYCRKCKRNKGFRLIAEFNGLFKYECLTCKGIEIGGLEIESNVSDVRK